MGRDIYKLKDIQKYTRTKIVRKDVPSLSDVEESRTNSMLEKLREVVEEGGLGKYTELIEKLIEEDYTSLDLAAGLMKMILGKEDEDGREAGIKI